MIPPETELSQSFTLRLIPSAFYDPPILRPLVDTDAEKEVLQIFEGTTSKRLSQRKINPDFRDWGSSCVEAAFAYKKEGGNRFNDFNHGAWYAAFDERTAIEEVAFHKTRELGFIKDPSKRYRDEKTYSGLQASFIGRFHDVRGEDPRPDYLDPDTDVGYPAGQALANELLGVGSRGLVYPSVRYPGGTCLVAFQEIVVQDVRPGSIWKLTWTGTQKWKAEGL
jgi:RES domain-containing protein